jgi:hypothetical protein
MNIPKLVKEFSQDVPNSKIKFKIHFNNSNLKTCPEDSDKKQYTLNLKYTHNGSIKTKVISPMVDKDNKDNIIGIIEENGVITNLIFELDFSNNNDGKSNYPLTQIGEEYKPTVLFTLKDCNGVVLFAGSFCVRDLP